MNIKSLYNYANGAVPKRPFLDDECYERSVRANVNPCTDCAIVDPEKKTIFLPTRSADTASGVWFIGGVWKAQVSAIENMVICFNRETGSDVMQDRFARVPFVDENGLPPQTLWSTGRNDLHFFYSIVLSPEEREIVAKNLDKFEYDETEGLREFTREQLIKEDARDIVIDCYDRIMS